MANTRASTYRLGEETEGLLDWLGRRLGGISRTAVIRLAVRRLADAEAGPGAPSTPATGPKKKRR